MTIYVEEEKKKSDASPIDQAMLLLDLTLLRLE